MLKNVYFLTGIIVLLCSTYVFAQISALSGGTRNISGFTIQYGVNGYWNDSLRTHEYYLEGKVDNDYSRDVSTVELHFSTEGTSGDPNTLKMVYINNLGPQDTKKFQQRIWNWKNLRLEKVQFMLRDGTKQEVRP